MKPKTLDYAILDKLALTRKPVGVKFLPYRPEGIERIQKSLNFCQMFVEAQTSAPFYVQREDLHCVEPMILGMEAFDPVPLSGLVGEMDDLYEELRANQKIYHLIPRMLQGSVKCVVFSSVDQITFDPDVLGRHDRRHGPGADHHEGLGLFDRGDVVVQGHAGAGLLLDVRAIRT